MLHKFTKTSINRNYAIACRVCTLFLVTIFATLKMSAVPAYPHPIEVAQPDGTTLTVTLKGDEFASWAESSDDYTLLRNSKGFFEYAQENAQGDLILSGRLARNIQHRNAEDNTFLQKIPKKLVFSSSQRKTFRQIRQIRQQTLENTLKRSSSQSSVIPQRAPFSGTVRTPIILVEFPDKSFTRTKQEFEMLCNQLNYTATADGAITGSVRDYFLESSYGQLDVQFDVFGPFLMSQNIAFYDDKSGGNPQLMAREAAIAANGAGCNFANYDRDNNGYVDGMHIIYAGYDQSAGEPKGQGIWAHAWAIQSPTLSLNGKRVYRYSCSSELRNNSSAPAANLGKITHIGTVCHEMGHVFGLPDLYDTDYEDSGGQSLHIDSWCIMASGSWNNSGATPALHSAWCKNQLEWIQTIRLEEPADITIPNPAIQGTSYIIATTTPNEYFLLENRQQQGFDRYIPASGLLIYHADDNYITNNYGAINADPSHRGLYIKQAGGNAASTTANRTTDPYPQGTNNSFLDNSVPNSKSWAGANTNKPVTDIVHNTASKTISFEFMGGLNSCPRPSEIHAESVTTSEAYIHWTAASTESSWRLGYKKQGESNFTEKIVTSSPYRLLNLDLGTAYDIQIIAICADEESDARSSTFTTLSSMSTVDYTIISHDAYGDGWNGAQLLIKQNNVVVATIENENLDGKTNNTPEGEYNTHTVSLYPCTPFELVWKRGLYDHECSFVIKDNNNVQIFATYKGSWEYYGSSIGCYSYDDNQVVFSGTTNCLPMVIAPGATEKLKVSVFNNNITFQSNDKDGTGQLIIDNGTGELQVTGKVRLEKEISKHDAGAGEHANKRKWYAIGFPFDIASIQCSLEGAEGINLDAGDDFWLSTIKDGKFEAIIDELNSGTKLSANQGYAIQFPDILEGETVIFISGNGVTLSNASNIEIPTSDEYTMIASPSVADIEISMCPANQHLYLFDGYLNFMHYHEKERILKPFESLIVLKELNKLPAKSISIESGTTGLINVNPDNDEIIAVRYYNLQGIEISKPIVTGVYIIKTTYKSNRVKITKVIVK